MPFSDTFHPLRLVEGESLPVQMNNPFDYEPHPLCCRAADEVCAHLGEHPEWAREIAEGKMFGVLIVQNMQGELGYLAAFSGNLDGKNFHQGFVPPVYDMLRPDEHFRRGEAEISAINHRIAALEQSDEFVAAQSRLVECEARCRAKIEEAKSKIEQAKRERDALRVVATDPEQLALLIRESQHQKAEFARLKKQCREQVDTCRGEFDILREQIDALRTERKRLSEELQMWIFEQFEMLNARGEQRDLCDIFEPTAQRVPPAGAGECAAPKLLQYAYTNDLQPLAMAEFWQGRSPRGVVRRHGGFYPSCQGKCGPILGFMLQGLDIENREVVPMAEPTIVYEDSSLAVVVKPAEMLSVEGRVEEWSVESWARERFKDAEQAMVAHRLDMSTSGLLVVAKSLDVYRALQEQFHAQTVEKRYMALLEGEVVADSGRIELPLAADYDNRPCQRVDFERGKRAITEFRVIERRGGQTLVEFTPLTGRTHQLRLHSAHTEGLNAPIVGDALYGRRDERLCLHAARIAFTHPVSGERVEFDAPCEF